MRALTLVSLRNSQVLPDDLVEIVRQYVEVSQEYIEEGRRLARYYIDCAGVFPVFTGLPRWPSYAIDITLFVEDIQEYLSVEEDEKDAVFDCIEEEWRDLREKGVPIGVLNAVMARAGIAFDEAQTSYWHLNQIRQRYRTALDPIWWRRY